MGDSGGERGRATLRAIFEAARDPELSAEEFRVWAVYRSYETPGGDGGFPSLDTLSGHLGQAPRTIRRHRRELLERGWLERQLRGPKPAAYRAVVPDGAPPPSADEDGDKDDEYPAPSEATGGNYPAPFETVWAAYPDREGGNPKKAAYRKWLATVRNGADPEELLEATRIYARRMEREGNVGGRFVKQARTFFGPDDYWREELRNGAGETVSTTDLDRQRAALDALDGGRRE